MGANTVAVTDASFATDVLGAELPVLVDFWAPWCGPCKMVAPILEEIAGEKSGALTIAKVNVDENPTIAGQFGVMSIPTMILFHKGKAVGQLVGSRPKSELTKILDNALAQLV